LRTLAKQLLALVLASATLASTAPPTSAGVDLEAGGTAVVARTGGEPVQVRAGTGTDFAVLTVAPEGAVVAIIAGPFKGRDGTPWYGLSYGGTIGYVRADFLAHPGDTPAPPIPAASIPDPAGGGYTATITGTGGDGARIRDAPSLAAAIVIHAPENATVAVSGSPRDSDGHAWYPVGYLGLIGWVAGDFLGPGGIAPVAAPTPPGAAPSFAPGAHVRVGGTGGDNLRIRESYGFDGGIVGHASPGTVLAILDGPFRDATGGDWYAIDHDGLSGYAVATYLSWTNADLSTRARPGAGPAPVASAAPPSPAPVAASASAGRGQALADAARRYLAYPYAWGGSSPGGFDCSGFTMYVANQALGHRLGRDTGAQIGAGRAVDARELQPGDLVFFVNTYQPGLSHVGIYIGGGQMIGAASERTGVAIANVWDGYWGPRFYAARRL